MSNPYQDVHHYTIPSRYSVGKGRKNGFTGGNIIRLIWLFYGVMCMSSYFTCLGVAFEKDESLSEVSDPHEELSLSCSELPNFLAALGEGGGGLRLQT